MHLRIANPNMLLWPPPLAPQALLERDPGLRPTVAQCLEHPWITQFSDQAGARWAGPRRSCTQLSLVDGRQEAKVRGGACVRTGELCIPPSPPTPHPPPDPT